MSPRDAATATASEATPFSREHVDDGVLLPRRLGDPVTEATPQIDHLAAIAVDGYRSSDLLTAAEVAAEHVGDLPVPFVDIATNEIGRDLYCLSHDLLRRKLGRVTRCYRF